MIVCFFSVFFEQKKKIKFKKKKKKKKKTEFVFLLISLNQCLFSTSAFCVFFFSFPFSLLSQLSTHFHPLCLSLSLSLPNQEFKAWSCRRRRRWREAGEKRAASWRRRCPSLLVLPRGRRGRRRAQSSLGLLLGLLLGPKPTTMLPPAERTPCPSSRLWLAFLLPPPPRSFLLLPLPVLLRPFPFPPPPPLLSPPRAPPRRGGAGRGLPRRPRRQGRPPSLRPPLPCCRQPAAGDPV